MSCPGAGHCAGCGVGGGAPVLAFAAFFGVAWVAEHLIEVAVVSAMCGVLAVAAEVALMHWGDRNGQDFTAELERAQMHYAAETYANG